MSIQGNINQMVSVLGLLASQSGAAERRSLEKTKKTKEEIGKIETEISREKAAAAHEERLLAEQKEKDIKTAEAKKFYETQFAAVKPLTRTQKGEISKTSGSGEWIARISEREGAISAAEELRKLSPSLELETSLGSLKTELNQLKILQQDKEYAERKKGEKATKKQLKEEEAKESAAQAQASEQRRYLSAPPVGLYNEPSPTETIKRSGSWNKNK